jgi:hypothetical protein
MPTLNQTHAFIERSEKLFVVEINSANIGVDSNDSRTKHTHYLHGLDGALKVADEEFDDNPMFWRSGTGLIILEEPHDEDEKHTRVTIRPVRTYKDTSV